jgi:hypothetical protein
MLMDFEKYEQQIKNMESMNMKLLSENNTLHQVNLKLREEILVLDATRWTLEYVHSQLFYMPHTLSYLFQRFVYETP